jgi:hypothetical protein
LDLEKVLTHVEKSLPAPGWSVTQQAWTPDMLRQAAALLGEKERGEKIANAWSEGRSLTWTARNAPSRQLAVGLICFRDAVAAKSYLGLAVDLQRKRDEITNAACADCGRVIESRSSTVALRGADETARSEKKIASREKGATTEICQLWVRTGNRVVEFTWTGVRADMAWTQRVLDLILSSMPSNSLATHP